MSIIKALKNLWYSHEWGVWQTRWESQHILDNRSH